jgi:site-specific DNA-methyltransferase (adenine-specific)
MNFKPIGERVAQPSSAGRWPANVILDEEAGAMLDEDAGEHTGKGGSLWVNARSSFFKNPRGVQMFNYGDSGGASRFFYCAKASRSEREAGLDGLKIHSGRPGIRNGARRCSRCQNWILSPAARETRPNSRCTCESPEPGERTAEKPFRNHHPTVKALALMRYVVRLTKTPTGGVVLDPFAGSGTTGIACVLEGRPFIGIEKDAEYAEIARRRIDHWTKRERAQGKLPLEVESRPQEAPGAIRGCKGTARP